MYTSWPTVVEQCGCIHTKNVRCGCIHTKNVRCGCIHTKNVRYGCTDSKNGRCRCIRMVDVGVLNGRRGYIDSKKM